MQTFAWIGVAVFMMCLSWVGISLRRSWVFVACHALNGLFGWLLLVACIPGSVENAWMDKAIGLLCCLFFIHWVGFASAFILAYRIQGVVHMDETKNLRG